MKTLTTITTASALSLAILMGIYVSAAHTAPASVTSDVRSCLANGGEPSLVQSDEGAESTVYCYINDER